MTLTRELAEQAQELVARMARMGYEEVYFLTEPFGQRSGAIEMVLSGIRQGERREISYLARTPQEMASGIAHFELVLDEAEALRRRKN